MKQWIVKKKKMKQWIKKELFEDGRPTTLLLKLSRLKSNNLTTTLLGRPTHHTTISDKCGDPYIVAHNPRIHDLDDVFPKRLVKITHTGERKSLKKSFFFYGMKKKTFFYNCLWKGCFIL